MKDSVVSLKPVLMRRTTHDIPATAIYDPSKFVTSPQSTTPIIQDARNNELERYAYHEVREQLFGALYKRARGFEYKPTRDELDLPMKEINMIMKDTISEIQYNKDKKAEIEDDQKISVTNTYMDPRMRDRMADTDYMPDYAGADADMDDVFE